MQTVYLTGVVDDGTVLGAGVPRNTAKTIQLPIMSPITVEVAVVNNAGVPFDLSALSAGWSGYLTVVKNPCSCEQAAGKVDFQLASTTIKESTRNVLVFDIPMGAFRTFVAGRWFYDVSLVSTDFKWQVVRLSGLHLEQVLRRA